MTSEQNLQSLSKEFTGLIRYIFRRQVSAFIIIFGRRGSGKTDLSLLIMEILYFFNEVKHFASNIKIFDAPFEIKHVANLTDLRQWCQETKGKKIFILDEAGRAFKRRTPMAKINVEIIDQLQILRKYKLSSIYVTPDERYLDSTALGSDVLDGILRKLSFKNKKLALYEDQLEGFVLRLWDIPRTSIKFDTWDSATFTLGQKISEFQFKDEELGYISNYTEGATIKEMGLHREQWKRIQIKHFREYLKLRVTRHKTYREGTKNEVDVTKQ